MTPAEKSAFNDRWLKAWTDKDVDGVANMYAPDCTYWDSSCKGLTGREALRGYLSQMFPHVPEWTYHPDSIWPNGDGFCARWFLDMGGKRLRGFDFVILKDGLIAHNEVYTVEV
jgi:SnoaL-like domain